MFYVRTDSIENQCFFRERERSREREYFTYLFDEAVELRDVFPAEGIIMFLLEAAELILCLCSDEQSYSDCD